MRRNHPGFSHHYLLAVFFAEYVFKYDVRSTGLTTKLCTTKNEDFKINLVDVTLDKDGIEKGNVEFLRALGSQSGISMWQHTLVG